MDTLYEPSEWGKEYHSLPHREALGAGAAGPGKTTVLIMEPFHQIQVEHERCADKEHPYHQPWGMSGGWALFLRRTHPMLEQIIARTKRIFPRIDTGAKFSESTYTWHFSSGYRYQFGHCRNPDDWEIYYSNEYCMAKGQRVRMGDGSLRPIEDIRVGDRVMTLEGPRKVTATHTTGVKPCVSSAIECRGETVGRQVHPTTHPVLLWPTDEWRSTPSHGCTRSARQSRQHAGVWQDYESLLDGRSESPVRRVSQVDAGSGFVRSDGSRLARSQLPALSVPVALHAPSVRQAAALGHLSTRCPSSHTGRAQREWSSPALQPPAGMWSEGRQQAAQAHGPAQGRAGEPALAGGGEDGRPGLETATGLTGGCSPGLRPRGERLRPQSGTDRAFALPRAGAASPGPREMPRGVLGSAPGCSPGHGLRSYAHFYTGDERPVSEAVRRGTATMKFAGWLETFDLTVEGANSYISECGLVNAQTVILFDELSQFEEEQYQQITSRLRSTDPVLKHMLKVRSMSNPLQKVETGITVKDPHWVRRRFVDPAPQGRVTLEKVVTRRNGEKVRRTRIYLPATLYDNPDPEFVEQYEAELLDKPAHIRKALLEGDWYVTPGSYFGDVWDTRIHTVRAFNIPDDWLQWRSIDWGFKLPGTVLWYAMDPDENIYVHREYTFQGRDVEEVGRDLRDIEKELGLWGKGRSQIVGPADDQLWEARGDTGKSKAAIMAEMGIHWTKADKSAGSRQRGAERIHKLLGDHHQGTTQPGLVFFDHCRMCIMTIPGLQCHPKHTEQPLDGGDDHWFDALRYGISFASHGRAGIPPRIDDDDEDEEEHLPRSRMGRYGYGSPIL